MTSITGIKDILKPPFTYDLVTGGIFDRQWQIGSLCKLTITEKHREIAEFICTALNNEYQRQFAQLK